MHNNNFSYDGKLVHYSSVEKYYPASNVVFALDTPREYATIDLYKNNPSQPILVNTAQHYQIISDIVSKAFQYLSPLEMVIMRFHFPAAVPLPDSLLTEKTLITIDPEIAAQNFIDNGIPCLTIHDRIFRNRIEYADNSIKIRYFPAENITEDNFDSFIAEVEQLGFAGNNHE